MHRGAGGSREGSGEMGKLKSPVSGQRIWGKGRLEAQAWGWAQKGCPSLPQVSKPSREARAEERLPVANLLSPPRSLSWFPLSLQRSGTQHPLSVLEQSHKQGSRYSGRC